MCGKSPVFSRTCLLAAREQGWLEHDDDSVVGRETETPTAMMVAASVLLAAHAAGAQSTGTSFATTGTAVASEAALRARPAAARGGPTKDEELLRRNY